MTSASAYQVQEKLRDGTPVVLRAVRPDDRARLVEAFHKLDAQTVYTRFFSSKHEITDADLSQGIDVDFVRNVTLVVTLGAEETIIGAGRYIGLGDRIIIQRLRFQEECRSLGTHTGPEQPGCIISK